MKSSGSEPTTTTIGTRSPRSKYVSRIIRPCLPGLIYTPRWFRSNTWFRYVPAFTQSESGSRMTLRLAVPRYGPPAFGCQVTAAERGVGVDEDPALVKPGDLFEQHARRALRVVEHLGDLADVRFARCALDN